MLHQEVTLQDAVMAIQCVQVSQLASEASLLSSDSLLQSDFPEDSTAFYDALEANILRKLHLSHVDYKALQSSSKGKSQPAPTVALPSSTLTASNTFYSDDRTPLKRSWGETVFSPPEKRSTERKRLACRPESVTKVSLSRDDLQHLRDVVPASPRIDLQEISFPSKKMSAGLFVVEQSYPAPLDEEKMESFDGMNGATFHHPDTFHRPNTNISKNFTFSDDIILEDW